jgi:hypothetical protein
MRDARWGLGANVYAADEQILALNRIRDAPCC